ncbi:MAG: hypothetical protein QOF64_2852, partial [Candidatus Binatota bacterium]|nr:hypothetical protein [Candidatus Binatota bacterium]
MGRGEFGFIIDFQETKGGGLRHAK